MIGEQATTSMEASVHRNDSVSSIGIGVLLAWTTSCSSSTVAPKASHSIYVANCGAKAVSVYAGGANGNAAPTATIIGANTGLNCPNGLAFDNAGRLYVADHNNSTIRIFAAGAMGNAPPADTIAGANTGLN